MADVIDYATRFIEEHLADEYEDDYPWMGLVIDMFQYLNSRGFTVVRDGACANRLGCAILEEYQAQDLRTEIAP